MFKRYVGLTFDVFGQTSHSFPTYIFLENFEMFMTNSQHSLNVFFITSVCASPFRRCREVTLPSLPHKPKSLPAAFVRMVFCAEYIVPVLSVFVSIVLSFYVSRVWVLY